MTEIELPVAGQSEALALFGPQDQYLKRLRKHTDTTIVLRGNRIYVSGQAALVERCAEILQDWQQVFRRNGELLDSDVTRSLDPRSQEQNVTTDFADIADVDDAANGGGSPRERSIRAARGGRDKLSSIKARTEGQERYLKAMTERSLVFCDGPAGCGKTYLAVAMALQSLRDEEVRKIVLVRPAVEAGEKLGFLPGDMFAKVNPFIRPLLDAVNDMLDFDQVRRYMANDVIEIAPLAFMRGRTLNDTFMILDEGQNTTATQMKMFLTRMGVNSRIVVTGDATQNDLPQGTRSGLVDGIQRLSGIKGVEVVRLTGDDIVRHRLVRDIVAAYERPSNS